MRRRSRIRAMLAQSPPQPAAAIQPARTVQAPARVSAARREFASMSPEQRRVRAEAVYRRTWEKAAHLYGRTHSDAAPTFSFEHLGPETYGEVSPDNTVNLSPSMIRMLAKRPVRNHAGGLQYGKRRLAQEKLLHEWAHVYQNPAIQEDPNENHREEAAELFATYNGHKLFGGPRMAPGPIPYQGRKAASRDLAAAYGPGYWRKRQFLP